VVGWGRESAILGTEVVHCVAGWRGGTGGVHAGVRRCLREIVMGPPPADCAGVGLRAFVGGFLWRCTVVWRGGLGAGWVGADVGRQRGIVVSPRMARWSIAAQKLLHEGGVESVTGCWGEA